METYHYLLFENKAFQKSYDSELANDRYAVVQLSKWLCSTIEAHSIDDDCLLMIA